jgi:hypothetical protein
MTTEPVKQYASEGVHWYDIRDGSPCYEVENKSRPGTFRPMTLRDAKKLGYPCKSVTGILDSTHKPALEMWKMREVAKACIDRPFIGGEDEAEYISYVLNASKEKATTAAEKGSAIHGSIEKYLAWASDGSALSFPPDLYETEEHVRAAIRALDFLKVDWRKGRAEKSFACAEGYGGKVDMSCDQQFNRYVVDFKTKDDWEDGEKLGWDENVMQLAAYANGLGMIKEATAWPRLISIFISRDVPGKWFVKEWDEEEGILALKKFRLLLEYWFLNNNYRPNAQLDE